MGSDPIIGVVGGSGAVGGAVLRNVAGFGALRVSGRDRSRVALALAQEAEGSGEAYAVDPTDRQAVRRFCEGCDVVINCAGPSCRLLDSVATAAIEAGAHYVDPGGDDPLHRILSLKEHRGTSVILSAGMLPGLSGLLPARLLGHFDAIERLTGYAGGLDRFSPAGAEDFLVSLSNGFGWGGMCIRQGEMRPSDGPAGDQIKLPLATFVAEAHPFVSTEFQRVCRRLGVPNGDWYNVFAGRHVIDFLRHMQGSGASRGSNAKPGVVNGLVDASELDVAGRTPQQIIVIEAVGRKSDRSIVRTIAVRAGSGAELTGSMAACAALAVLGGRTPAGVHYAADILSPEVALDQIKEWQPDFRYMVLEGGAIEIDEGVL
ncbi:MAG: saccharopine dehydrogenase NADP-binding domain-containing protein [Pseudolabrys sp.]